MSSLRNKMLAGFKWSFIEKLGFQGIKFFIGIVLARLLTPEDYGLIGIVSIFLAISMTLVESGFGSALIQKKEMTSLDVNTVIIFNFVSSIILCALVYGFSPVIADFYQIPELTNLIRVLSFSIVINSFSVTPSALLKKKLDFKSQSYVSIISVTISGIVGITMAYSGFGVWALVIQNLLRAFFKAVLFMIFSSHKFKMEFSSSSFKSLFSFGGNLLATSILNVIFKNIYIIIIGKFFSSDQLGYYTRAKNFQTITIISISEIVNKVTFPVFSSINDDKKLTFAFNKIVKMMALIAFTSLLLLASMAKPLILTLLTEKWLNSVLYLQLLCISGMFYPLHALQINIIKAKGQSRILLKLEVYKKMVTLSIILISIHWGIVGLLLGNILISIISYGFNLSKSSKVGGFSIKQHIIDIIPSFLIAILVGISSFSISYIQLNNYLQLIIQLSVAVIMFISLNKLFKVEAFQDMNEIFKTFSKPKNLQS